MWKRWQGGAWELSPLKTRRCRCRGGRRGGVPTTEPPLASPRCKKKHCGQRHHVTHHVILQRAQSFGRGTRTHRSYMHNGRKLWSGSGTFRRRVRRHRIEVRERIHILIYFDGQTKGEAEIPLSAAAAKRQPPAMQGSGAPRARELCDDVVHTRTQSCTLRSRPDAGRRVPRKVSLVTRRLPNFFIVP